MSKFELEHAEATRKSKVINFLFLVATLIILIFLVQKYAFKQNTNISNTMNTNLISNVALNNSNNVVAGNYVLLNYVGYLEDGTVFETSIKEEAEKAGIYSPSNVYKPLQFQIGSKQVINGIENAVLDMIIGGEKEIELQPKDAYGDYDPSKIVILPRIQEIDLTLVLDRITLLPLSQYKQIFNKDPIVNEILNSKELPWQFKIIKITDQTIFLEHLLGKGQKLLLPQTAWESVVEEITESQIFIKQNPQQGQKIQTNLGENEVIVTDSKIRIKSNPEIGKIVKTPTSIGKISDVNETSIVLDFNHPLAGKILNFKLILVNISNESISEDIGSKEKLTNCPDTVEGNINTTLKIKYFYSPFCPWCIKEEPILKELIKSYGHLFHLERYDIRYCLEHVNKYQVSGTPTFVFSIENGTKEFFHPGFIEKDKLKETICGITNGCSMK